jgi:epoxyqueuosine reductase
MVSKRSAPLDLQELTERIKHWGVQLGFQQIGITDTDLTRAESHLTHWLELGRHGEMHYMSRHGLRRSRPTELVPGTIRVISARMDYWPRGARDAFAVLDEPTVGFVSRYALGRDYHKLVRKRLQRLVDRITAEAGPFGYRVFADSAPVLEKALAEKAGLGWIGKHTNLINKAAGSWFFLGEIYTDLPLPVDPRARDHCGTCTACMGACPTDAIVAPYQLDARRCISYLTIELRGPIPVPLRTLIGNRIFGCDDCQLVCPWNRFARVSCAPEFSPREQVSDRKLVELFKWTEREFAGRTSGSAIRRIGYERWLRNIAVALGNTPTSQLVIETLENRVNDSSDLVREHVLWALAQHY